MVKRFQEEFKKASKKKKIWKKFLGLPKKIRYPVYTITIAGAVFFFSAGGMTWLWNNTKNIADYFKKRSQAIERKVEYAGDAYIPLIANSNVLSEDLLLSVNANGLESITGMSKEGWLGKYLNKNLGAEADSVLGEMNENPALNIANIGFYVKPDSSGAYNAALIRDNDGNLELALFKFSDYDKLSSLEDMAAQAEKDMENALVKRDRALAQKAKTEKKLTETKTELTQTKQQIKVYTDEEEKIKNDYLAFTDNYNLTNVDDTVFPGLETKLQGDIKYNLEFRPVMVKGRKRYEAIVTHEIKEMSLSEKTRNLSFLETYMTFLKKVEDATKGKSSELDAWKARPWIDGLTTTITPVEWGLQVTVKGKSGNSIFSRSLLEYRAQNLKNELKY